MSPRNLPRSYSPASSSPEGFMPSKCTSSTSSASIILTDTEMEHCNQHDDLNKFIPVGVIYWRIPTVNSTSEAGSPHMYCPEADSLRILENSGWIKLMVGEEAAGGWIGARVYVRPEEMIPTLPHRSYQRLRRALREIMAKLDTSADAWNGLIELDRVKGAGNTNGEGETLFYIFNTLESPNPEAICVADSWARAAIASIMYSNDENDEYFGVQGLITKLYPYQQRSAALMIQKEVEPSLSLDPRLQALQGPTGSKYYYDRTEGTVFQEPKFYSNVTGGILAETMGYGKTLICLAVILATRGHMPSIPSEYVSVHPVRGKTGSLMEMAAAAAGAYSLPWAYHFGRLEADGMHYGKCLTACARNRGSYTITRTPKYGRRNTASSRDSSITVHITSASLVVVPPNLVDHWLAEIAKHTEGLKVLVLRDINDKTPPAAELLKYDIVLFSQARFKKESGGFSAAAPVTYSSPLRALHWLRIIVDEGHNFAGTGGKSSSVYMLDKLQVERRWVVSGTPSKGLYGIEISLAAEGSFDSASDEAKASDILNDRKSPQNVLHEELKRVENLRSMVVDFLNLKPWANSRAADPANWTKYMTPIGPGGKRIMSSSLRSTLQSLVVRHRSEDVHRELPLPKLHNEVVYLEPTFYDRASLNLFILRIVVNTITSERSDEDYLFHPKNRKHISQLMNNLRLAGFWWPAMETETIQGTTLKVARQYLEKNMFRMADKELVLLRQAIITGETILSCSPRNALCQREEIGIFVENFPEHARGFWAIDESAEYQEPLLLGLSLAREAQKFVTAHLCSMDPGEGLAGAGLRAKQLRYKKLETVNKSSASRNSEEGIVHRSKPEKSINAATSRTKSLPADSSLKKARVIGTVSAKLTYLLEKVLEFQDSEKIIIFYESENTAFWIAEGLELLGTDFRIYASTLKPSQKSEYLSVFNGGESVRVLLMDLRQAAHGLHIAAASRVYIVNPIWDPNIESQAIKRAHRISQSRPVYVETLVLKGTLEEKMLKRRKQMSSTEMQHAEKDMLDDNTMSYIIQNEGFLPLPDDLRSPSPAFLKSPLGLFDRYELPIPGDYDIPIHSPVQQVMGRMPELIPDSPTPDKKRRLIDSPGKNSPKRRQESRNEEYVNQNGIKFISPRSTPRRRRTSSNLLSSPGTSSNGNSVQI
ncbi:hypothetical protein MauCBS54593_003701 [Microsporum audouinii]